MEQAISDEQTAEGALKAARDAVRVFGKSEAEIGQIIASRSIDPALVVRSSISGQITSFNGPPGLLVQPGNPPAPYTVADVSIKWMLADAVESDIPFFHIGQPVQVKVMAYPDRLFQGKVSKIYAAVDPDTHRVTIRSEITDPRNELRPGNARELRHSCGEPGRNHGDTRQWRGPRRRWDDDGLGDNRSPPFSQRIIKTGMRRDGLVQILDGLQRGELVVTDGAVFLSNMLQAPPTE